MRTKPARVLTLLSFVALVASSCSAPTESGPLEAFAIPDEAAYITGPVVWRDSTKLWVERSEGGGYASAVAHLLSGTVVVNSDETGGDDDDIVVGTVVSVWTTGFEFRSDPPQVEARMIVIDR